jgi:hypothetical protein
VAYRLLRLPNAARLTAVLRICWRSLRELADDVVISADGGITERGVTHEFRMDARP